MKNNMVLLTSMNFIRETTNISDNVQDKFLLSAVREAQEMNLQEILGSKLYNTLQDKVDDDSIFEEENKAYKELLDYCQYFLAYQTIAKLTVITNFKVNNIGLNQTSDDNVSVLNLKDTMQLQGFYQDKADFYIKRLQGYLMENVKTIPEVKECNYYQMHANLNSATNNCPIWLGGSRGKGVNNSCKIGYDK